MMQSLDNSKVNVFLIPPFLGQFLLFPTSPLSLIFSLKPVGLLRRSGSVRANVSRLCKTCREKTLGGGGCFCLFTTVFGAMFPPHSPPSDVFLLYLVTTFWKQMHSQKLFFTLSIQIQKLWSTNSRMKTEQLAGSFTVTHSHAPYTWMCSLKKTKTGKRVCLSGEMSAKGVMMEKKRQKKASLCFLMMEFFTDEICCCLPDRSSRRLSNSRDDRCLRNERMQKSQNEWVGWVQVSTGCRRCLENVPPLEVSSSSKAVHHLHSVFMPSRVFLWCLS